MLLPAPAEKRPDAIQKKGGLRGWEANRKKIGRDGKWRSAFESGDLGRLNAGFRLVA